MEPLYFLLVSSIIDVIVYGLNSKFFVHFKSLFLTNFCRFFKTVGDYRRKVWALVDKYGFDAYEVKKCFSYYEKEYKKLKVKKCEECSSRNVSFWKCEYCKTQIGCSKCGKKSCSICDFYKGIFSQVVCHFFVFLNTILCILFRYLAMRIILSKVPCILLCDIIRNSQIK